MSTADWEGVPLGAVLDRVQASSASYRVLVSGVDDEASRPVTSVPGASWIFSRGDLERAMLATRMNGAPLPRDHGAPVRLIVPGWYGCACIKWVDRIELRAGRGAGDDADAGVRGEDASGRRRASGSRSACWRAISSPRGRSTPPRCRCGSRNGPIDGRVAYRIVGIIWGGSKPTNALSIRFRSGQPWVPVDDCPLPDVDADVEPVVSHVASRGAGPLPDRPARQRPVDPHAAPRHLFLRERIEIDEV